MAQKILELESGQPLLKEDQATPVLLEAGNYVALQLETGQTLLKEDGTPLLLEPTTFTLVVTIPACQTRDQELAYVEYACRAAARQARSAGGQVTTGIIQAQPNMLPGIQLNLATYTYLPGAPS